MKLMKLRRSSETRYVLEEEMSNSGQSEEEERRESDQEYEVERIVDIIVARGKLVKVLIQWKNYSREQDSWEPLENLATSLDEYTLSAKVIKKLRASGLSSPGGGLSHGDDALCPPPCGSGGHASGLSSPGGGLSHGDDALCPPPCGSGGHAGAHDAAHAYCSPAGSGGGGGPVLSAYCSPAYCSPAGSGGGAVLSGETRSITKSRSLLSYPAIREFMSSHLTCPAILEDFSPQQVPENREKRRRQPFGLATLRKEDKKSGPSKAYPEDENRERAKESSPE